MMESMWFLMGSVGGGGSVLWASGSGLTLRFNVLGPL